MSRKRNLKKQLKHRAQWVEDLEDLYLRQADEAFLEAARPHIQELDAASMAGLYDEVVDRALAAALTGGDSARVGELLLRIRRGADPRPLVLLAETMDLLANGRYEPAAARLASLRESDEAALGGAQSLPEKLRLLAGDGSTEPLLRSLELEEPAARLVWDFYRALAAVAKRNFRPGAKTLSTLAAAVEALRNEGPADLSKSRFLAETEKRLRALTDLRKLEQSIRRRRQHSSRSAEDLVLEYLDKAGHSATGHAARLLHDDPPALLRPLQHALRARWHEVLELVRERRGTAGLAMLLSARPELLAAAFEPVAVAEVRRWAAAKSLLESESFCRLAAFLRSAAARAETAQRLAALWSLELWARQEGLQSLDRDEPHQMLVRLREMAIHIGNRFAADERPQVARFLRGELFALCGILDVCNHFLDAAQALMKHLDDDLGLLAVALASAISSQDDRARREVTARIAARGRARTDHTTLLRLTEDLAAERPAVAVPVLTALRPLFKDAGWSEVLDRVAPGTVEGMREGLVEASRIATADPETAEWILHAVRRDLELYRPLFDGRPELAALDLAFECWGAAPSVAKLGVRSFLHRFEGLEPALVLYRQTLELNAAGGYRQIDAAIIEAIVDRLDARLHLWTPYLIPLVFHATAQQIGRMQKRIRGLLKDGTLEEDDRWALEDILDRLGEIRKTKRLGRLAAVLGADLTQPDFELPEEPEPKPKKPRTRRLKPGGDRQQDLFVLE